MRLWASVNVPQFVAALLEIAENGGRAFVIFCNALCDDVRAIECALVKWPGTHGTILRLLRGIVFCQKRGPADGTQSTFRVALDRVFRLYGEEEKKHPLLPIEFHQNGQQALGFVHGAR